MISRFLAKIVITIAVLGFAAVELGSPLIVRAQLDGVANDVASEAALAMFQSRDPSLSRATADRVVAGRDATLQSFAVDGTGTVSVWVSRQAPSLILKRWDTMKSWYDVVVSASARKGS
ncbi:MAG: hypothetical protein M3378_05415 [Actinomycetota bacterium]|nr:hypothetical protein [Actinomycetota bacterium]MDQ3679976.1 hypothetical protein [Actinomycetota bacterium]